MAKRHGPGQLKRQLAQKNSPHQNKYAELVGKTKPKKVNDDG